MDKKMYIMPTILRGPINPDSDVEEDMEYSQAGSGTSPVGGGSKGADFFEGDSFF